ncbi:unnamed protein product [Caenorhabditis auriculariae]|uniref:Protein kinase domain-containing protein n=1 Tax=Caenorhabditis auriculariae TaxID=2777116 RepID=A0A8S1GRV9_9PELO|nr:unnamed protein product [Caenorhabditis auriculariae]
MSPLEDFLSDGRKIALRLLKKAKVLQKEHQSIIGIVDIIKDAESLIDIIEKADLKRPRTLLQVEKLSDTLKDQHISLSPSSLGISSPEPSPSPKTPSPTPEVARKWEQRSVLALPDTSLYFNVLKENFAKDLKCEPEMWYHDADRRQAQKISNQRDLDAAVDAVRRRGQPVLQLNITAEVVQPDVRVPTDVAYVVPKTMKYLRPSKARSADSSRFSDITMSAIDSYKTREIISTGTYSTVKLAFSREGRSFVVKTVQKQGASCPTESDIEFLRKLKHPNITRYYAVYDDPEGQPLIHILMEFMPDNLDNCIKKERPLSLDRVISYTLQIADGLKFLHSENIIHHDLKPLNILVRGDLDSRVVKIADFGSIGGRHGTTPLYTAPEVVDGNVSDARSDVWSFGVIVIEMSTGKYPWDVSKQTKEQIPILHRTVKPHMTNMPSLLVELVDEMLAPLDFRHTAEDVLNYLDTATEDY